MADETEPTSPPSANQQGDLNIASGGDTTVSGSVVGRDQITNITNIIAAPPGAPVKYATRADYLAQIIDRHQNLEFVGIPELKDRQALRIEDVFIHLQAEIETVHTIVHGDLIVDNPLRVGAAERLIIEGSLIIEDKLEIDGEVAITEKPSQERLEETTRFPREKIKRRVSINDALRDYRYLLILGDPGAGKTTLLKYITVAFAQGQSDKLGLSEDRLPIFVRLYDYVTKKAERREDYSLIRYLYTQAEENLSLKLEPGFFETELERGNCCVCLDGLDELGGAGLRREVTSAVASLANRYPRNCFIVTSRIVGYEEAPLDRREFAHHTVLPLTDDDISEFVKKWYGAREKDPASAKQRAEHLTKTVMNEPRIKSLAANPLMLTIIALVHRIEVELPHERVKLYDKCVTALVETWEKVKGLTIEDRERPYYKYRRRLLEQLAFWMHAQPGAMGRAPAVKEGDLELQLTRFLQENRKLQLDDEGARQEAQAFIALAKSRTGLLIERGEGVYSFAHLTFQEYLAASDIEHRLAHSIDMIWVEIQPRLHDPSWREVILLLLGSLNKFEQHPTELVRRIFARTDEYEDVLHRHLFLAARALADHVEVEAALHIAIVNSLLTVARDDPVEGKDAFIALGALQDDVHAAAGLLALARDNDASLTVRCDAAHTIGLLGRADDVMLSGLLALAQDKDVNPEVQRAAALTLGQLGCADEAVLAGLLAIARNPQAHAGVRRNAVRALGQLSHASQDILSGLLALARDPQPTVKIQRAAALALGQLGYGDEAMLSGLLALARDPQVNPGVRRAAANALGQLGHTAEAAAFLLELTQVITGRRDAVDALGRLGYADKAVLTGLLALGHNPQMGESARRAAALALWRLGHTDDATALLLELARDPQENRSMRYTAALALGQLGRADEAATLLIALALAPQTNYWVRRSAIQALERLSYTNKTVLTGLLALAHNTQMRAGVRRAAVQALGQLGHTDQTVRSGLIALASDPQVNDDLRCDAAQSLGQLGHTDEAVALLRQLARDPKVSDGMRCDSAQFLGQLGHTDEAVELLLALVSDEEVGAWVRRNAVQALGQLGRAEEGVLSSLLALARNKDGEERIRGAAYEGLKALLGGVRG